MTKQIKQKKVMVCGVPYKIVEREQEYEVGGVHFGEITYKSAEIKINKDMPPELKNEALCHEIVHVILLHIGENEMESDERFVQSLANAIYQTFMVNKVIGWEGKENV